MNYPRIEINLNKITHNAKAIVKKCNKYGIDIAAVTKVACASPYVCQALVDGGVKYLADSRISNLKKINNIDIPKILLRLPMISEIEDVIKYADISLNSELKTIKELSNKALEKNKVHNIILMVDLGDLREGFFNEKDLYDAVEKVLKLKGIKLVGIGTNLTCYGGVIPDEKNLGRLVDIAHNIEDKFKLKLDIISGGNSSSLHLVYRKQMPEGINQLRLGESLVLGRESAYGNRIEDTYNDAFNLVVEVIELKEKPSIPIGEIGMDAFGNKPIFTDRGVRKRMICAIGKQDVDLGNMIPLDEDIIILGESSDHLVLDISDSKINYKIGDKVKFRLDYAGVLKVMTSEYVNKVFL